MRGGATTFSRILEMKLKFEIGRRVVEIDHQWLEMVSEKRLDKSLFEWRWKNSFRKREIDKIWDGWTRFIEAEFQKESWDGIQGTLFTFRSRNKFVNFNGSGWNKID